MAHSIPIEIVSIEADHCLVRNVDLDGHLGYLYLIDFFGIKIVKDHIDEEFTNLRVYITNDAHVPGVKDGKWTLEDLFDELCSLFGEQNHPSNSIPGIPELGF